MHIHALPRPAYDLREATRSLTTPSEQAAAEPRPEPSDELLAARRSEPVKRVGRTVRNLAVGAGACFLTGTAAKVCGGVVGALGAGGTVGILAGLAVGLPVLLLGVTKNWKAATGAGIALVLAGGMAGFVGGAYLGWHTAGSGLSLGTGLLGASALLMKTRSSSLDRKENEFKDQVKQWEERQAAFGRGEKPAEPEPLEAPSAIEQLGDLVLVGGIRLPSRLRPKPPRGSEVNRES